MVLTAVLRRLDAWRRPLPKDAPVSLNRQLFRLAWPSLVENLLQTLLVVVDLIFVGKLGAEAIAGVGLGGQFSFLLQVLFMGLAVGNTALVARAIGAGDPREAERVAKQSLVITGLLSVVIALVGGFYADAIVRVMGATESVTAMGGGFLRIIAVFSVVIGVMIVGGGTLRGAGDTRTPMLITGLINVINVVLAYLLIFGNFGFPRLGALGSAAATTLARGIGAGLVLWVLFRRSRVIPLALRGGWGFHRDVIARILNIGVPSAAEQIVFQLGFFVFSAMAVSLGTHNYAAQQIAFNISNFSILPGFAFGVAALTLVGQSLGAKSIARAEASALEAMKSGVIWMTLVGIIFFIGRDWLIGMYTDDPLVWQPAEMCLIFIALGQPMFGVAMVLGQALRGAGDTRATLVITFIGMWIVRVGLAFLLGLVLGWGLFGLWLGWISDFFVRAVLVALRFRAGVWKTLRV